MNGYEDRGPVHQVVFRWEGNHGRSGTGMSAVAHSCSAGRAEELGRDLGPLLWVSGTAAARPSVVRTLSHDGDVMLVRRWPTTDRAGRPSTVSHVLVGSPSVLKTRLCLSLAYGGWGRPEKAERATGKESEIDCRELDEVARRRLPTMLDRLSDVRNALTMVTAELLRDPAQRVSLLVEEQSPSGWPGRDEVPLVYLGLFHLFGPWLGQEWTFATYDTADSHDLRLMAVPGWEPGTGGPGPLARVLGRPPAHPRFEHHAAGRLVQYLLAHLEDSRPGVPHLTEGKLADGASLDWDRRRALLQDALDTTRPPAHRSTPSTPRPAEPGTPRDRDRPAPAADRDGPVSTGGRARPGPSAGPDWSGATGDRDWSGAVVEGGGLGPAAARDRSDGAVERGGPGPAGGQDRLGAADGGPDRSGAGVERDEPLGVADRERSRPAVGHDGLAAAEGRGRSDTTSDRDRSGPVGGRDWSRGAADRDRPGAVTDGDRSGPAAGAGGLGPAVDRYRPGAAAEPDPPGPAVERDLGLARDRSREPGGDGLEEPSRAQAQAQARGQGPGQGSARGAVGSEVRAEHGSVVPLRPSQAPGRQSGQGPAYGNAQWTGYEAHHGTLYEEPRQEPPYAARSGLTHRSGDGGPQGYPAGPGAGSVHDLRQELREHRRPDGARRAVLKARLAEQPDEFLLGELRSGSLSQGSLDLVLDELAKPDRVQVRDLATRHALCTEVLRNDLYFTPQNLGTEQVSKVAMAERAALLFHWAVAPLARDERYLTDLLEFQHRMSRLSHPTTGNWLRRAVVEPPDGRIPDLPPQLWRQILQDAINRSGHLPVVPPPPTTPAPTVPLTGTAPRETPADTGRGPSSGAGRGPSSGAWIGEQLNSVGCVIGGAIALISLIVLLIIVVLSM